MFPSILDWNAGHLGGLRSGKGGISLGASGAIYGLVGLLAYTLPQLQASIIFVPVSTDLSVLFGAFMGLDVLGILLGWRTFNHWAHLGDLPLALLWFALLCLFEICVCRMRKKCFV